jgi:hypothetical protein
MEAEHRRINQSCDDKHGIIIDFSSENKHNGKLMIKDKRKSYVSKVITFHDNRKVCSDAEKCVNSLHLHLTTRVIEGRSGTYTGILEGLRFGDLDNVFYAFDL